MTDGPEWFAPKRYGYGSGLPIAWQGWVLLIVYLALVVGSGLLLERWPALVGATIVGLTALLMLIAARTTKGGWRWRWGKRD
jgi:hypothetical protein